MESEQKNPDGVSLEASSVSASPGPQWAYEKYFKALKPQGIEPPEIDLYDIDKIAQQIKVEDEDDLGDDGKPLVITIKG